MLAFVCLVLINIEEVSVFDLVFEEIRKVLNIMALMYEVLVDDYIPTLMSIF